VGLDNITSVEMVTHQVRLDLATLFLPLYCGLFLLGLYIVSRYRINRDDHSSNLQTLAGRSPQDVATSAAVLDS